ncbi:ABC transporter ATP-binding protein [Niveispirillum irakense]|uniref:ABC transporter ATP-binding protein n=1 Tax=Niveispirillum irakense TaxID=34011 RepID=UPI00040E8A2A|nr:ABC transporter ATP-binding protein [Niveispirillum irakense]
MTSIIDSPLAALRRPAMGLVRLGMVLGAVGALSQLLPFIFIARLGELLLAGSSQDRAALAGLGALVVAGLFIGWAANGAALWLTHIADHRIQADVRRALVAKLGRVPLGWYAENTTGAVRKAVQGDLEDLHHMVAHHYVDLTAAIALPLGGIAYLVWLDWRLALLAVASFPIYALAYGWMMRGFGAKMAQLDASFAQVNTAIVEFVHGIAVVKGFGRAGEAHSAYRAAVDGFSQRYAGWVRPLLRLEALTSMALSVPVILLVSLSGGAWLLADGQIAPMDLLAEIMVAVILPQSLLTLNQGLMAERKAAAAASRIDTLLRTPELPAAVHPRLPRDATICFNNVSFQYPDGATALSGIDLYCRPGTVTALVGPSGAGKSTLAKLAARFHDVSGGVVRIGGIDVRDIAGEALYRHVGFVLQEVGLLHGSIADNIRLGRPESPMAAVMAAARAAQIHDRIQQLPQGYDSIIGAGAQLSGGEAQRLSIARALLADTPILILDEATAHADPDSEARIQDALSAAARGRTVLVIAHRLSSIAGADQIVVMRDGTIAECGRHGALLASGGLYAALWQAEQGEPAC